MIRRLLRRLGFGHAKGGEVPRLKLVPWSKRVTIPREMLAGPGIPIDRTTEYVPELGNIRSCVRPEEYVYDWQKDGL